MFKKSILMSPGPVMSEESVRQALLHYDVCHRAPEFENAFAETLELIKKLFKADDSYQAVIVSGSGTSANECVLASAFKEGERATLIRNGMFGERLQEIMEKHGVPYDDVAFPWGTKPDLAKIEEVLKSSDSILVAMVCHESSTGMLNPIHEVGALAKKYGKRFFIDTVSAVGGEYIDVVNDNVDIAVSVGGKCLGAYPGSAYVLAKKDFLDTLTEEQCKTIYLNLYRHYHYAVEKSQTPNTPNTTLVWALKKALENVLDEGVDNYIDRHAKMTQIIREGLAEMGMKFLLPEEEMGHTITSVFLPEGIDLATFLDKIEKRGYTNYPGKGAYGEQGMFYVSTMGAVTEGDCYGYLGTLKSVLEEMRAGC